jgi:hypothetical protein
MTVTVGNNLAKQFSKAVHRLDLRSSDPRQFEDLLALVAPALNLNPAQVLAVAVTSAPMVVPMLNDRLAGGPRRLLLAILAHGGELHSVAQSVAHFIAHNRRLEAAALCVLSTYGDWYVPAVICRGSDGLGARIKDLLSPSAQIIPPAAAPSGATRGPGLVAAGSTIVMDERIMRMVRLALASSSAVILVGPPGTGKTTILKELLQDVAYNPSSFGLRNSPREPKWVTPSESWTSTDLVGGPVSDEKGRRRFRLGHVLEAIHQDRWLVLDEANRANMDMIFGGLLTWLSDQRVELGRASSDLNSPSILLDWNDRAESRTERLELLDTDRIVTSEPIKFLAGVDWRLLGTYNVQDAHKVFTFGQALGRRFARVPIPVIEPSQFRHALASGAGDLPKEVQQAILGLYAAHHNSRSAQLGPAIFLKMASYVAAGMKLPQLTSISATRRKGSASGPEDVLMQLVAEAYLSSAGIWLAKLSGDDFAELGKAVLAGGFSEDQWQWIRQLAPTLG